MKILLNGDLRLKYLKDFFCENNLKFKDSMLLPIQGLTDEGYIYNTKILIDDEVKGIKYIYVGVINDYLDKIASKYNITLKSYIKSRNFVKNNSYLTAEALLPVLIRNTSKSLKFMKILVLGYGNCGKEICNILQLLGSELFTYTKLDIDKDEATKRNINLINDFKEIDNTFDIIINTIPDKSFGYELLSKVDCNSLIVDISSKPGSIDLKTAKKLKLKVLHELGLPGKYSAFSSSKLIFEEVNNLAKE